jgi:hypothetical protein
VAGGPWAPTQLPPGQQSTTQNRLPAAYHKGNQRLAQDWQTGDEHVLTDQPDGPWTTIAGPTSEIGNPILFDALQSSGRQARIEFANMVGRDLVLQCWIDPPEITAASGTPSPLLVQPNLVGMGGATPEGGCEVVGQLICGHLGCSVDHLFNIPGGFAIKVGFSGESASYEPILVPKYWLANDTNPLQRTFDVAPGEPLTNAKWNQPNSGLLQRLVNAVGPTQAGILTGGVMSRAYFDSGSGFVDNRSRPSRRFSGALAQDHVPDHTFAVCPVAYNCSTVELVGGTVDSAGAPIALHFYQTQRGQTRLIGPSPLTTLGVAIPLVDNCDRIFVTNAVPVAAGTADVLFELNFYLGL